MEDFQKLYKPFHKDTKRFLKKLPKRVKKDCADKEALKNVKFLPKVLRPKDPGFRRGDVNMVTRKLKLLVSVLRVLLPKSRCMVKDKFVKWQERKSQKIVDQMDKLESSAANLDPGKLVQGGCQGDRFGQK